MSNMKEIWGGSDLDAAGARVGGEKRPYHDHQPPEYDPRQRRRTDDMGFAPQQVRMRTFCCLCGRAFTALRLLRRQNTSRSATCRFVATHRPAPRIGLCDFSRHASVLRRHTIEKINRLIGLLTDLFGVSVGEILSPWERREGASSSD